MDTNINNGSGLYDLSLPSAPTAPAQVVTVDDDTNFIVDLTSATRAYCSMVAQTPEEQADLYTAMNAPDKRISECIGDVIELKDVYVESVRCANEETGEVQQAPRIVLIAADGTSYQCVSRGIFGALKKLFTVYGEPTAWAAPIKVKLRQIPLGKRSVLTLDVVRDKK